MELTARMCTCEGGSREDADIRYALYVVFAMTNCDDLQTRGRIPTHWFSCMAAADFSPSTIATLTHPFCFITIARVRAGGSPSSGDDYVDVQDRLAGEACPSGPIWR